MIIKHNIKTWAILLVVMMLTVGFMMPRQTNAFVFGGKILSSQYRTCYIYVGVITIPVPLQVVTLGPPSSGKRIVYIYYALALKLFHITTFYSHYDIYKSGVSVLGTYIPVPIPWVNCPDLYPTNIIEKVGTSLF